MKQYLYSLVFAVLAVFGFTSCANEVEGETPVQGDSKISASIEKAQLATDEETHGISTRAAFNTDWAFFWTKKDKISVGVERNGEHSFATYMLSTGENTNSGTFVGSLVTGSTISGHVVYPSSLKPSVSGSVLTIDKPQTITYTKEQETLGFENVNPVDMPMYAHYTETGLQFKHMGAYFVFEISKMPADCTKFVFTASSKICGSFEVDLSENLPTYNTNSSASENEIVINFPATAENAQRLFTVPVPVGSYTFDWELRDSKDNLVAYGEQAEPKDMPRGRVRAYRRECGSTSTGDGDSIIDGHEGVDLGLPSGIIWATCNIGASTPEGYGDYFAWGEISGYMSGKTTFDWSSYKWCNGSQSSMTKYCTSSSYGIVDNKSNLEPIDDASTMSWGGNWRTPTKNDFVELIENTENEWVEYNGKYGRKFTSKIDASKWIFIPAAGGVGTESLVDIGSSGYYWSSSLYESISYAASILHFNNSQIYTNINARYYGRTIRAVNGDSHLTPSIINVSAISINGASKEMKVGTTQQLSAVVTPENATNKAINWSTSNSGIATVSNNGLVTAVKVGSVTITATAQDGSEAKGTYNISVTDQYNGHEYVDLGLSVKWATCNVGANEPEERGYYFAWGETSPHANDSYSWSNYNWCRGSSKNITKYCTQSSYGTVDNKVILESSDDAAHVNWGGNWRIPTSEELNELRTNCKFTWTTQNGVKGCIVKSNKNGKSIFIPATGHRGTSPYGYGINGFIVSSSLVTSYNDEFKAIIFTENVSDIGATINYYSRCFGHTIRAVCK